ncbi:MAG TPA: adenylate/guanylate cyclase domain-containing protein, partial [Syntrophales bacterium]|nr:adenylate/guanylate cyclase domain-containing protein [Syntrophales bacterium]
VHTGEVVVGNIGFDKKMDYTVIGDSVNTVFKLQELTKAYPNSVLISDRTLHAVRAHLNVGEVDVSDPAIGAIKVYELTGVNASGRIVPEKEIIPKAGGKRKEQVK